jgi:hypothetical protein
MREDETEARVIDAELDAQEAEATAGAASAPAAQPATQRPWWETDSRFADRFRALDDPD